LIDAARHFLNTVPPLTIQDLTATSRSVIAEITALTAVGSDHWLTLSPDAAHASGWTLAAASAPAYDDTDKAMRHRLISWCVRHTAETLPLFLTGVLDSASAPTRRLVVEACAGSAPEETRATFLEWATAAGRTPEQWADTLHTLTAYGDLPARAALRHELATAPAAHAPNSAARTRWVRAAYALMFRDNHFRHTLSEAWPGSPAG
jgi:hypothetical protein